MAELVVSAFAAVGSAATAATATAGSWLAGTTAVTAAGQTVFSGAAAASAAAAAGAGSTAFSILQGVATAGSILATLAGGAASNAEAGEQAQLAEINAEGDRLASEERALRIRRDLLQRVGAARVAFAGSGVSIAAGQPAAVEQDLRRQASFELGLEKSNAALRRASGELKARSIRRGGQVDLTGSYLKAGITGLNYGLDIAKRG